MNKRLENKDIVVTAAGQGIGRATAIAFHNEGANIIATDINEKTLETLNKEYPNIKVKNLDSTINKAIEEFSATLDKVDVLFNAVGFVHHGTILDCDEKDLMKNQCLKSKLMPSDIAKAVLFFSSDQSSGCTNQSYVVDKGWL